MARPAGFAFSSMQPLVQQILLLLDLALVAIKPMLSPLGFE